MMIEDSGPEKDNRNRILTQISCGWRGVGLKIERHGLSPGSHKTESVLDLTSSEQSLQLGSRRNSFHRLLHL